MQAGEVNGGEFDPFLNIIPGARAAGAWTHVDGAFGLWARASKTRRALTDGIEQADSWTTDGHKWLNTPYDGAMAICRNANALAEAMNSDAVYAPAEANSQKYLTLEFSRRARGVPIWAALRAMGRDGVAAMVDRHCSQALRLAEGLRAAGYEVINRVAINQVLVRSANDSETLACRNAAVEDGRMWFGTTIWNGRVAMRLSISSWRTTDDDVDRAVDTMSSARRAVMSLRAAN